MPTCEELTELVANTTVFVRATDFNTYVTFGDGVNYLMVFHAPNLSQWPAQRGYPRLHLHPLPVLTRPHGRPCLWEYPKEEESKEQEES